MLANFDTTLFTILNNLAFNLPTLKYMAIFGATALISILFFWYALAFIWHKRSGLKELTAMLAIGLLSYITNQLISLFWFRPRPFVSLITSHKLIEHIASKSFPSDHATLAFLMAYILSWHKPEWRVWAYTLATMVALSRVLVGVHYPLDIITGAIIGTLFGFLFTRLIKIITAKHA